MSLQYDGLQCPRLEKSLMQGAKLGIFRSVGISLLSRLQNDSGLIASKTSDSLNVLLKETDWELNIDKLSCHPIFRKNLKRSALEDLVTKRGFFIGFDAKYDVLNGYLIDANKNILVIRRAFNISSLLQQLELEAIKYL